MAVKATEVPGQMAPAGKAAMLTVGVRFGLTLMVIVLEEAVVVVKQVPPVTVMSQVTALPLARVVEVKVLDVPDCTLLPPILKS